MVREILYNEIQKAVKNLFGKEVDFSVISDGVYADYSSNVAFVYSKVLKKDPVYISFEIIDYLKKSSNFKKYFSLFVYGGTKYKEQIPLSSSIFVNVNLNEKSLEEGIKFALKDKFDFGKNEKVQVEFISANPTGPLTVGNARGGPFGDTLANILKTAGFKVEKAYYINDWGNQILILGHSVCFPISKTIPKNQNKSF